MTGDGDGATVAPVAASTPGPLGPFGSSRSAATTTVTSTTVTATINQKTMSKGLLDRFACGVAVGRWVMLNSTGSPR